MVGIFVPLIPGIPLAWLGLFIYAIGTGFERISITTTVAFLVMVILISVIDFLTPTLGAKKYKASKYGILGAFLGMIVGIIFFGPIVIIVGPFLGAFILELIAKRQLTGAFRAAAGTFIGFLIGSLMKTILIFIMLGFFIASLF